jgi:hypothetical protein
VRSKAAVAIATAKSGSLSRAAASTSACTARDRR